LNLPVRAGLARIPSTSKDRLDSETLAFHERVAAGYRQMALEEPNRWREVDATASPDAVAAVILSEALGSLRQAGIRPVERRSA
jgi:dTMP kinase